MRSYSDDCNGKESDRFSIKTFMSDKENPKLMQLKQRKIFLEKLLNEKNQLLLSICKEVSKLNLQSEQVDTRGNYFRRKN